VVTVGASYERAVRWAVRGACIACVRGCEGASERACVGPVRKAERAIKRAMR
jgi:hypothetical protein